ncbi:ABC transporter ATP-binding protein [Paenibacillus sp. GSMTC-2017]|uniref:ABC transporter ATP-binding protein n=1 Tax=Paenibacillus sp. GSMTC-2017 TaxID=2794350 RepID=UPI0018D5C6D0|nr:dipeptide/oligopeptide/nickel ABC transporter ATP-binding protein [Paenibacillus sp. GSMTC-2017]MBH5316992.1 ABC transporter ATP-binding protein [Paenibacillus sp. GSMTC-2017]
MNKVLIANNLVKRYSEGNRGFAAINDVSLHINEGECLGLVGESGSGKSTLAKVLVALETPDKGDVWLGGKSLFLLKRKDLRTMRQHIGIIFQNSNGSLNDSLPVWRSIMEPLDNFPDVNPSFLKDVRHSRRRVAERLLEMVGLQTHHIDRYPHELSGGERQRITIARAMSVSPQLLVCDEPTSSLDVTIQEQILNLLKQFQHEQGVSCLFISHDIAAVHGMSDRIIVMKKGAIVDHFHRDEIWSGDRHPYTAALVQGSQ